MKHVTAVFLFALIAAPVFAKSKEQIVNLQVTEKGFEPASVNVKPGATVVLKVTRKTDATCAMQIKVHGKNIEKDLPLNEAVSIALGKLKKGEIRFSCSMDMITGNILVN